MGRDCHGAVQRFLTTFWTAIHLMVGSMPGCMIWPTGGVTADAWDRELRRSEEVKYESRRQKKDARVDLKEEKRKT